MTQLLEHNVTSQRASARTRSSRLATYLGAMGLGACLVLAGQASTGKHGIASPTSGEPRIGEVARIRSVDQLELPLDAYQLNDEQRRTVRQAIAVLTAECMHRHGLEPVPESLPASGQPKLRPNERRYGLLDAVQAARSGYHVGTGNPTKNSGSSPSSNQSVPSAGQLAVAYGGGPNVIDGRPIPAGGCYGEARRTLSAPVASVDPDSAQQFAQQSFELSRRDSRVGNAFAAWSACMGRSNLVYADPLGVGNDPSFSGPVATSAEKRTATIDVACKQETNVAGVWLAVESAYQQRVLAQNPGQFAAIKSFISTEVSSATRAIKGVR
jgi:hypothetical protein